MENRTGNLGDNITISREEGKVVVVANGAKFSGRYLKYLTKKFLKKQNVCLIFERFSNCLVAGLVESYFNPKGSV